MGQSSAPSAVRRTPMLRRITTIVALAILAALLVVSPARADHNTAHTIEQLTAHYQDPALETQNKPFALLYLRTTEAMRDANDAGGFSDPQFWDQVVIPTFANYYLDAYQTWKRGDAGDVDPAWRIAFRTEPERLNCTQMLYLGINAHVNNDLAFMIEAVGPRYLYPDHKHVDDRSEEHTSELQSRPHLVCRLLLEKKKKDCYPRGFTEREILPMPATASPTTA